MEQTVQFKNPLISSQELVRFREKTNEFQRGEVSEDEFTAFRLQHGVYGQRQDDVYMIRIKLPAGRLTRAQLKRIGELHQHYALTDIASITTRQDIQLHFVPLKDVPAVLEGLAAVGLTTREACGNTVRNISACPMAGVCPSEHTDVLPLVDETARHFLRHPLTQHLPRKVKMSFSGCEQDCAQGRIHDIAVVAVHDVAKGHGFRLLAGGGLGHKPHDAIVIEPFLLKEDLLAGIEALITVHHRHSDRTKRAKSRIKFLVDRFGEEELRRMYQEEFPRVKSALKEKSQQAIFWFKRDSSDSTSYSHLGAPRKTTKQRQPNQYAVPVSIPLGDLNAEQIFKLVNVMDQFGLDELKATQDQNLIVNNVREDQMSNFKNALVANQFSLPKSGDDVVSCPGTWTCRLGITSSREISKRINTGDLDLRVRVSGCHNGCAQPYVGDIGLHGEGKRLHGKLVPHYQIHLGGNGLATGQIAIKGPYIPVARINRAIKLVQETYRADHAEKENFSTWVHRKGQAFFTELLSELTVVTPDDLPYVLKDVGEEQDFRVLQLGGGECAGIAQETLAAILAEIKNEQKYRDTFFRRSSFEEAVACIENSLTLGAKGLLFAVGEETSSTPLVLREQLQIQFTNSKKIVSSFLDLNKRTQALHNEFDRNDYAALVDELDPWLHEAGELATNKELEFKQAKAERKKKNNVNYLIDVSSYRCPMHYIKARQGLNAVPMGKPAIVKVSGKDDAVLVSDSLKSIGYQILSEDKDKNSQAILIKLVKTEKINTQIETA